MFLSLNLLFLNILISTIKGVKKNKLIEELNLEFGIKEEEYRKRIIIPLIKAIIITTTIQIFFPIVKIVILLKEINEIKIITKDIG
jgi:hypothetical protein